MKTRSITLVEARINNSRYDPQGDWMSAFGEIPGPQFYSWINPDIEQMFEAYTGPNPTGGQRWTNFSHYRREMGSFAGSMYVLPWASTWPNTWGLYWLGRFAPYFGWIQHQGLGTVMSTSSPMYMPGGSDGFSTPIPTNLSSLLQKSLSAMMPGIKTEMSSINSVIELKDFKGLAKAAVRGATKVGALSGLLPGKYRGSAVLRDLYNGWIKYIRDLKKAPLNTKIQLGVGAVANNFLQWKFAVKPLIDDVLSLKRALKSLDKQINRLVTNEGRVRTSHWTTQFESAPPFKRESTYSLADAGSGFWPPSTFNKVKSEGTPIRTRFHVELRYNYNLTQYQRENARLLALLDSIGIQLNPAIVWNAVRYTFLIDWVIGVSRYLDQFKVANMGPKINVSGALWSALHERVITWEKTHETSPGMSCTEALSMPAVNETGYTRKLFSPSASSLIASGLSSSEFTLGAALVIAHRRRKASK
jgi:hypothetical protein